MIDFHTHILPGIDDGSRNPDMTGAMLQEEAAQGVELVIATPHFYPNRMSVDGFLSHREKALQIAERIRREAYSPLPEVRCGAEVYYFRGIGKAAMIPRMCIGETKTLLLEMPFAQWEGFMAEDVQDLLGRGMNVVLAHIERYEPLQKKKDIWDKIMALPVRKQINSGSFIKAGGLAGMLGGNRERNFCMKFLKENPGTILGSDCHNTEKRRPNLGNAISEIVKELGEEVIKRSMEAAKDCLMNNE